MNVDTARFFMDLPPALNDGLEVGEEAFDARKQELELAAKRPLPQTRRRAYTFALLHG